MMALSERTDKATQSLVKERYQQAHVDSITDCLERAKGIAGLMVDLSISSQECDGRHPLNAEHIEHTIKAVYMEIQDALIILDDWQDKQQA